jgi:hypothetical protein
MIFGRVICMFKGHKRGRLVRTVQGSPKVAVGFQNETKFYACPRCGHETRYKVRPPAANVGEHP